MRTIFSSGPIGQLARVAGIELKGKSIADEALRRLRRRPSPP